MRRRIHKHRFILMGGFFVITLSFAVAQWMDWRNAYIHDMRVLRQQIADVRADNQSNQVMCQAAIYGLSYALRAEQGKAGSFEARLDGVKKQASKAWGSVGAMTRKQNEMQRELDAYRNTLKMVSGKGWTSQAEVEIKEDE